MTGTATRGRADGATADASDRPGGRRPRLASSARDTLVRAVVRPVYAALAVAALVVPLLPGLPLAARVAPFAVSVVVFGLPHGAVDHLVPGRLGDGVTPRSLAVVGVVYAVLGGAYLLAWLAAPVAAFVSFVLLTWFHWGQGDVYAVLAVLDAEHLPTRVERALALLVRGGLPMAVPLLSHPDEYRRVAAALVALFDPGAVAGLAPYFAPGARLAVGGVMAGATLLAVLLGTVRVRRGAARTPWLVDAGEVALLWAFFLLVPPILAVGLYFTLWHSVRHIARLALADPPAASALSAGDATGAFRRFARDAAPLTAVSLLLFAGLYLAVPGGVRGSEGLLAVYLVGIAALTLPHVAVVTWMDRVQGVI
jgi:Brp/Blh family beta-carotene 15,15'-monooxygenase